jgi:5-methylcytosine-specific restriction endonuclease McrA
VIPIARISLETKLATKLAQRSAQLKSSDAGAQEARKAWRSAPEKSGIRDHLMSMAPGIRRCMYCGESYGTDIDHFEPIRESPAGTFEWLNHLLACSYCNSNYKRDQFPRDTNGEPLLIDPTREDPGRHLQLMLKTGKYRPLTARGGESIRVFGLNRDDLAKGRMIAFETRGAVLCRAQDLLRQERTTDAHRCLQALSEEPHASVLHEMLRSADMPGAVEVLGEEVVTALRDPRVLAALDDSAG